MLTYEEKRQALVQYELEWLKSNYDVATANDVKNIVLYIDALYTSYGMLQTLRLYKDKIED